MGNTRRTVGLAVATAALVACGGSPGTEGAGAHATSAEPAGASSFNARNESGMGMTIRADGGPVVDPAGAFSRSLGANGRSCSSCHVPEAGMTITPEFVRRRFEASQGTDPLFRTNDASTSPVADVSTVRARRKAYALLLDRALIRVGMGIPEGAEFELAAVDDPYGFAGAGELSLFRRPLPAANLTFLSTVMWDGRETFACVPDEIPCALAAGGQPTGFAALHYDLGDQANGATVGHAQGQPLDQAMRDEIVAHELALFTAQAVDDGAGPLDGGGALGGPEALSKQPFHLGVNDVFGAFGETFSPDAMKLFDAWASPSTGVERASADGFQGERGERRAAIARGQALFNERAFTISGVGGINDVLQKDLVGTCTTCHDSPNAGSHSVPAPLRIGIADPHPAGGLEVSGLPLYTLRNRATGELIETTDPGRALVTGKWADVGKFKGPTLRGLASRAPYFHNGSARGLDDVVRFYDERFHIGLTQQEKADLAAFLAAL
jgi:cytochrome c peroxidase